MDLTTERDRQRFAILVEADRELREAKADLEVKQSRVEGLQMVVRGLDKVIRANSACGSSESA